MNRFDSYQRNNYPGALRSSLRENATIRQVEQLYIVNSHLVRIRRPAEIGMVTAGLNGLLSLEVIAGKIFDVATSLSIMRYSYPNHVHAALLVACD